MLLTLYASICLQSQRKISKWQVMLVACIPLSCWFALNFIWDSSVTYTPRYTRVLVYSVTSVAWERLHIYSSRISVYSSSLQLSDTLDYYAQFSCCCFMISVSTIFLAEEETFASPTENSSSLIHGQIILYFFLHSSSETYVMCFI